MKLLIASILVLSISFSQQQLTEEQQQKVRKYRQECIDETKVNPELIDRADRGDFAEDANLKCFAKCFYQKAGFIDEKGELLVDVIKAKIPPQADKEKALAVVEKCKDLKGADVCEKAFLVHKCYFENTPHPHLENPEQKKTA